MSEQTMADLRKLAVRTADTGLMNGLYPTAKHAMAAKRAREKYRRAVHAYADANGENVHDVYRASQEQEPPMPEPTPPADEPRCLRCRALLMGNERRGEVCNACLDRPYDRMNIDDAAILHQQDDDLHDSEAASYESENALAHATTG